MKVFYALWIPVLNRCDLKGNDCNDCLRVKDIPNAPAYYFWGKVHPNSLNFTLLYTTTGNRNECKDAVFQCEENTTEEDKELVDYVPYQTDCGVTPKNRRDKRG